MSRNSMTRNGDEVREHEMKRLRCEIRERSMRGQSHDQIVHWLSTQESRITDCELVLAKLLARHHATRASSGVTLYLEELGRTTG